MTSATEERRASGLTRDRNSGPRTSRRAILGWAALGAVLVPLAFVGSGRVSFWFFFQRPLESRSPDRIVWLEPRAVAPDAASFEWPRANFGGWSIALPPAPIRGTAKAGESLILTLDGGRATIDFFAPGFLGSLLREESAKIGAAARGDIPDPVLLSELARTTLEEYRFAWDDRARTRYAVNMLGKLLLWEDRPVSEFSMARHEDGSVTVLVLFQSGNARVTTATERGVCVVSLPPGHPSEWSASPNPWRASPPAGER